MPLPPEIALAAILAIRTPGWAYHAAERRQAPPRAAQSPPREAFTPQAAAVAAKLTPPRPNPAPALPNATPVFEWRRLLLGSVVVDAWGYLDAGGVFRYTTLRPVGPAAPVSSTPQAPSFPVFCPPGGS